VKSDNAYTGSGPYPDVDIDPAVFVGECGIGNIAVERPEDELGSLGGGRAAY